MNQQQRAQARRVFFRRINRTHRDDPNHHWIDQLPGHRPHPMVSGRWNRRLNRIIIHTIKLWAKT